MVEPYSFSKCDKNLYLSLRDPVLTFPCKDMHSLCLPCFSTFCESKIKDRQLILVEKPKHIGYTLPCPGGGGILYQNEFVSVF